ncbi:AAA family ATPase [Actinoplanes sp. NPDC051470]|uniref:helix-turn-helix transcriptional regulator n=1 Tax=Actinoplanes sp. NPDC051470 TaxID=3157224 RepID=UPI00341CCE72
MTEPLERETPIGDLARMVQEAAAGGGCVAVVHGEAGIGKSSVITAGRHRWSDDVRVLVGYCDDLAIPRPLGPLRDLAPHLGPGLAAALFAEDRESVFGALRGEFIGGRATVLAVEDLQWADEATLDVLHFLVRRIADLPLALILTYRDEGVAANHRMRRLLGTVASSERVRHIALQPLTAAGVRRLSAGTGVDADWLYSVTAGNPFFVTEVIRYGPDTGDTPPTVVDAVLARTHHLGAEARAALEQLAMIPSTIELPVVTALVGEAINELPAAERLGLITSTPQHVSFRHELTRRALADSLTPGRQIELERRALAVLAARPGTDPSRLVHHAMRAGDANAVVRHGTTAARDASRTGAHREAVSHYRSVLAHRDRLSATDLAEVLEEYAVECQTTADFIGATRTLKEAVGLRRQGTDRSALGEALRRLSSALTFDEDHLSAESAAQEAVDVLSGTGDTRLLALAHSNRAMLHLRASEYPQALDWAERATAHARASDDPAVLSTALNHLGTAQWSLGEPHIGHDTLLNSLRIAAAADVSAEVCRAHINLAWTLLDNLRLDEAETHIQAATGVAEATEQFSSIGFVQPHQALLAFYRGHWDEMDRVAEANPEVRPPMSQWVISVVRGHAAIRRGRPEDEALPPSISEFGQVRDLPRVGLLASARAEAAWLRGDRDAVRRHAEPVYEWARRLRHPRWEHELGHWLTRAGCPVEPTPGPYELQDQGRHAEGAAGWVAAGMPYEQAAALAQSEDPELWIAALPLLDRLGALPLGRAVRRRLRRQGIRASRGPGRATRDNPAGLTQRQIEIARMVSHGWSNARIADALALSVRTIDNHVAAVMAKLDVKTRHDVHDRLLQLSITTEL